MERIDNALRVIILLTFFASNIASSTTHRIWLVKHSWHTGLSVAQEDLPPDAWPERADFNGRRYLEIGWGSKDFYMAKEPDVWLALKSGLIPGPAVLHLVGFDQAPGIAFPYSPVEERLLSKEQFAAIIVFIDRTFAREGQRFSASLGYGLYGDSRFYPANGTYHLLYTCNDWLDDALAAADSVIKR
jgi:uncharacterized protein (TIGR02117 family)